ncbi:MAG: photosynthetic complex assembly protein PuhC [Pseudomonadota bacterium]
MSELHENPAPAVPLIAAFGLIVVTLVGVAWQQYSINPQSRQAEAVAESPIAVVPLQFVDQPDGAVHVVDAGGQLRARIEAGEGGFLRGTLRGLVRERRLTSASMSPGFELRRFADGRVELVDLATTRSIDLLAFGQRNAGEFLRFFELPPQSSAAAADGFEVGE